MPKIPFTLKEVSRETFSDHVHALHTDMLESSSTLTRREALATLAALVTTPALLHAEEKDKAPAYTFDGKDDAIVLPNLQYRGNAPICIDTVISPEAVKGEQTIVGNMHSGGVGLCLQDGFVEFSIHNGKQYLRVKSDMPVAKGAQVHITASCDGAALRLFINQKLQKDITKWFGTHRASKHPFFIGADPDAASKPQHFFAGSMEQLRISAMPRERTDVWKKHPFGKPDQFDAFYADFTKDDAGAIQDISRFKHPVMLLGTEER